MATNRRVQRINSLLQEVISEVVHREVKDPNIKGIISISRVDVSADLRYAKVYVSVIGGKESEIDKTLDVLNQAAGYIAVVASKKVVMRYFPELCFKHDDSASYAAHIEDILNKVKSDDESEEDS